MSADPEVTREMEPVGNLLDNLPDSARLPTADDEPKWDVARWMAEGLGYPFDIETTIPLHP